MKTIVSVVVVGLVITDLFCNAGELEYSIAEDTDILIHWDVESFCKSAFGKFFMEDPIFEEARKDIFDLVVIPDLNLNEVSSVIMIVDTIGNKSVIILKGKFNIQKIISNFKKEKDYKDEKWEGYTFHEFLSVKDRRWCYFYNSDTIVILKEKEDLKNIMELLSSKEQAVRKIQKPSDEILKILTLIVNIELIKEKAIKIGWNGSLPVNINILLNNIKDINLEILEKDKEIFLKSIWHIKDPQIATDLAQIIEGILAMFSLYMRQYPKYPFIKRSNVSVAGSDIVVDCQYSSSTLINFIKDQKKLPSGEFPSGPCQ